MATFYLKKATIMRIGALLTLLLLGACSGLAPASVGATQFRNSQTGQIVLGCGQMQGFAGALQKAQAGCVDAFKGKGWTPLNS